MTERIPFNAEARTLNRSEIESLFIFRPDNLGDLVLFTGALRHILKHFEKSNP